MRCAALPTSSLAAVVSISRMLVRISDWRPSLPVTSRRFVPRTLPPRVDDRRRPDRVVDRAVDQDVAGAEVPDVDQRRRDLASDVELERDGRVRIEVHERLPRAEDVDVVDAQVEVGVVRQPHVRERVAEGPGAGPGGDRRGPDRLAPAGVAAPVHREHDVAGARVLDVVDLHGRGGDRGDDAARRARQRNGRAVVAVVDGERDRPVGGDDQLGRAPGRGCGRPR